MTGEWSNMQLNITFRFNTLTLPLSYGHIIQGIIYRALSSDSRYSGFLHNKGYSDGSNRKFKMFTFGSLRGNYTVSDGEICFMEKASIEIRSADPYFIQILLENLKAGTAVQIGNCITVVDSIRLDNRIFYCRECRIRMLTPVVAYTTLENGFTQYFNPSEESFFSAVESNAQRKWNSVFGEGDVDLFIAPCEDPGTYKKQIMHYKNTIIEGYKGIFVMQCQPELLNILYNAGLGSKNAQGFGMFEIES